ncbi:MAG: hypothetical protein ACPL2N_07940, partial [Candidatus Cryosericum sp.]
MDTYEVYVLLEQDPGLESLIAGGERFALAASAGTSTAAQQAASSIRELPDAPSDLLDPVQALSFLTWVRFAGRHYGKVIILCSGQMRPVLQGLMAHSTVTVFPAEG